MARADSVKDWALSVVRAWSGVSVRSRRTQYFSREGASKVINEGGGAVRFQKV